MIGQRTSVAVATMITVLVIVATPGSASNKISDHSSGTTSNRFVDLSAYEADGEVRRLSTTSDGSPAIIEF